jgi:hypothetical protein
MDHCELIELQTGCTQNPSEQCSGIPALRKTIRKASGGHYCATVRGKKLPSRDDGGHFQWNGKFDTAAFAGSAFNGKTAADVAGALLHA